MGFKENLKAQLQYSGMLVKELSALTGIKKATLDSYLRADGYTPSIEAGVKIARALGVSAEFLVLGADAAAQDVPLTAFFPEIRLLTEIIMTMRHEDRLKLVEIAKVLERKM
ncbi:MAG: helix-turn-helix domain-containing protein [Spirochaetaceae bacterium]|jgi:transcriptional regulator with XRE-family HTH domain|nr:helix-turn-helix domain-containing protein [Spirochaetaceae bacterium]